MMFSRQSHNISWFILFVLMLISWGIGLYFYSVVFGWMVIYIDKYYWVHPFWGLLAGAAAATLLTVCAALFAIRKNQFRKPGAVGITASGVTGLVWIAVIYFQIAVFNLNEGICH